MLELLVIVLFVAVVFYNLGIIVAQYRLRHIIFHEAKKRGLISQKEIELLQNDGIETKSTQVSQLFVEKVQDMLYMYDSEKNKFICQAKTFDELADIAYKSQNIEYAVVLDPVSLNVYSFVDGKVVDKK